MDKNGLHWPLMTCLSTNSSQLLPHLNVLLKQTLYILICVLSHFSRVWLCVSLWTVASQAPLFMGFSRQEYWSRFPCPLPGDLPNSGFEPMFLMSPALAGSFFTTSSTQEVLLFANRNVSSDSCAQAHLIPLTQWGRHYINLIMIGT